MKTITIDRVQTEVGVCGVLSYRLEFVVTDDSSRIRLESTASFHILKGQRDNLHGLLMGSCF